MLRHYLIVFGEPTNTPRVHFEPPRGVPPASVKVIDFLQGSREPKPDILPGTTGVNVTFPSKRWVLPRSGYVISWN
jgi:hypothetical protein